MDRAAVSAVSPATSAGPPAAGDGIPKRQQRVVRGRGPPGGAAGSHVWLDGRHQVHLGAQHLQLHHQGG